jgi:predicted 3-demethylubiquinone-9 3-methyltransferase (glyoxalase superfamily)
MPNSKISPFLTFNGQAEEAMQFYASVLPGAEITKLARYEKNVPHVMGAENENRVMFGEITFSGGQIKFLDMSVEHAAPAFSWSSSIYIDCKDEAEFDVIFAGMSQGGVVMMGPESVGPIRKCAWVTDKFGVTWQPVWA